MSSVVAGTGSRSDGRARCGGGGRSRAVARRRRRGRTAPLRAICPLAGDVGGGEGGFGFIRVAGRLVSCWTTRLCVDIGKTSAHHVGGSWLCSGAVFLKPSLVGRIVSPSARPGPPRRWPRLEPDHSRQSNHRLSTSVRYFFGSFPTSSLMGDGSLRGTWARWSENKGQGGDRRPTKKHLSE